MFIASLIAVDFMISVCTVVDSTANLRLALLPHDRRAMLKISATDPPVDDEPCISGESSSSDDDEDQDWADWQSDGGADGQVPCISLFDNDVKLPSATDCIAHDAQKHGFDLVKTAERLGVCGSGAQRSCSPD